MSEIRHRPSKTKTKAVKTKTRTATKSDTTKTVNKIRTSEKYDMVSDKNAVSISFRTHRRAYMAVRCGPRRTWHVHILSSQRSIKTNFLDDQIGVTKSCNGSWKCATKNPCNSVQDWSGWINASICWSYFVSHYWTDVRELGSIWSPDSGPRTAQTRSCGRSMVSGPQTRSDDRSMISKVLDWSLS